MQRNLTRKRVLLLDVVRNLPYYLYRIGKNSSHLEVIMLYSIEERINDYLNRTGTTREAIAADLGMSRQTFRKKVSGQIDFKLSESVALANILGCTVDDFRVPFNTQGVV